MKHNIDEWTTDDVIFWIRTFTGIKDLDENLIRAHEIDGNDLMDLTEDNLKNDLQIIKLHDRKLFLRKLNELISYHNKNKNSARLEKDNAETKKSLDNFEKNNYAPKTGRKEERFLINSFYNISHLDNFNNKSFQMPNTLKNFHKNKRNLLSENFNNSNDSEKLYQKKFDNFYNYYNEANKIKINNEIKKHKGVFDPNRSIGNEIENFIKSLKSKILFHKKSRPRLLSLRKHLRRMSGLKHSQRTTKERKT